MLLVQEFKNTEIVGSIPPNISQSFLAEVTAISDRLSTQSAERLYPANQLVSTSMQLAGFKPSYMPNGTEPPAQSVGGKGRDTEKGGPSFC
jgi:hypothetical protein